MQRKKDKATELKYDMLRDFPVLLTSHAAFMFGVIHKLRFHEEGVDSQKFRLFANHYKVKNINRWSKKAKNLSTMFVIEPFNKKIAMYVFFILYV